MSTKVRTVKRLLSIVGDKCNAEIMPSTPTALCPFLILLLCIYSSSSKITLMGLGCGNHCCVHGKIIANKSSVALSWVENCQQNNQRIKLLRFQQQKNITFGFLLPLLLWEFHRKPAQTQRAVVRKYVLKRPKNVHRLLQEVDPGPFHSCRTSTYLYTQRD